MLLMTTRSLLARASALLLSYIIVQCLVWSATITGINMPDAPKWRHIHENVQNGSVYAAASMTGLGTLLLDISLCLKMFVVRQTKL